MQILLYSLLLIFVGLSGVMFFALYKATQRVKTLKERSAVVNELLEKLEKQIKEKEKRTTRPKVQILINEDQALLLSDLLKECFRESRVPVNRDTLRAVLIGIRQVLAAQQVIQFDEVGKQYLLFYYDMVSNTVQLNEKRVKNMLDKAGLK